MRRLPSVRPRPAQSTCRGWDGRVWPTDDGWPDGTDDEEQVLTLMEQASLRATLTFPPHEEHGHATLPVDVQRAQGPFLMPPLPQPDGLPSEALTAKLRLLCEDPAMHFARPMKPAVASS